MLEFRYYCLHDDGRIAVGENVEAPNLDAAIHHAYEACRTHPTRAYRYVEVGEELRNCIRVSANKGAWQLLSAMHRHDP